MAGGLTCLWALFNHRLLLYGDATAHLAIARRMVDSATPGLAQWGTVWLPLPHLLMAPLVWFLPLWRNGLAGAVPSWLALDAATVVRETVQRLAKDRGARDCGCGSALRHALITDSKLVPAETRARLQPLIGKYIS